MVILKSGLELEGDIRIGDLVGVTQYWSAYIGGELKEGTMHIGEGIFVGIGDEGRSPVVDSVCVMMPHGLTWFNPSRLKLTLVSCMDDAG